MKRITIIFAFALSSLLMPTAASFGQNLHALVLHGGAGVMSRERMNTEREEQYRYHLERALTIGDSLLSTGSQAADAVVAVIAYLEDCPLFNAGKGAVFTSEGKNELDASIMDGATLKAGAVAMVTDIKNPIKAAKLVMDASPHVMLAGKGASHFAKEHQIEMVKNRYFYTRERFEALQRLKQSERRAASDNFGTVGCVALDVHGNIVAGTSTGGMNNKKYGRIGDSPIIGAGTWADNQTCGVSGTGHGEYFIRNTVARDVAAHMEYRQLTLEESSARVLDKLTQLGGTGGFIALDALGNVAMPFNTSGMFRAYKKSTGEKEISIFAD